MPPQDSTGLTVWHGEVQLLSKSGGREGDRPQPGIPHTWEAIKEDCLLEFPLASKSARSFIPDALHAQKTKQRDNDMIQSTQEEERGPGKAFCIARAPQPHCPREGTGGGGGAEAEPAGHRAQEGGRKPRSGVDDNTAADSQTLPKRSLNCMERSAGGP